MTDNIKQQDYSPLLTDDCYQYITKDIAPVKRKIVTAANRHTRTGLLLVGARHWSRAMTAQAKAMGIKPNDMFDTEFERRNSPRGRRPSGGMNSCTACTRGNDGC